VPQANNQHNHAMSFGDHLEELRRCLLAAMLGIVPIFIASLYYSRELIRFVTYPVRAALKEAHLPASLQSTGVFETFNASMQIALVFTIILGSPWILWQVWRFIAPGLHDYERRFVHVLLPLSAVLTIASAVFFYTVVLPVILTFMIRWGVMSDLETRQTAPLPPGIQLPEFPVVERDPDNPPLGSAWINRGDQRFNIAMPNDDGGIRVYGVDLAPTATIAPGYRVREYLGMLITMALSFAIAFQTPVVVLMLGWVGIIDVKFLRRFRRHAILASLIAGALLTPGDPVTFALVTAPIYLLYELGGLLLLLLPAKRLAARAGMAAAEDDMSEDPPAIKETRGTPDTLDHAAPSTDPTDTRSDP